MLCTPLTDSRGSLDTVDDFTLTDQAGEPWALSEHLDAAAVLLFLRGDW